METSKESFLSFKLGDEIFAISVAKVLEVLEMQKITKIPKTPDHIRGVINFRGEILPVIEMRKKFLLPDNPDEANSVIIVLDMVMNKKNIQIGAIADGVRDVLEIRPADILEVPEMGSRYNSEFLFGMVKSTIGFIMILNVDRVFSLEELQINIQTMNSNV